MRRAYEPLIVVFLGGCVVSLGACSAGAKSGSDAAGSGGTAGAAGSAAGGSGGASSSGAAGEAGAAGGASGAGTAGTAGTAGAAGSDGAAGAAGMAGAAGSAGTGGGSGAAGSGADAGSPDAASGGRDFSSDRTTFFGATRCAQAKVQLCEDFESGTLDAATWTPIGSVKPVIDGLQKARGNKALHIVMKGNGESAIRESKTFPAPNNTYYGRVFVYFAALPTTADFTYSHWTMIAATGSQVSGEIRVSGQMGQSGTSLWGVGTDNRTDANGTGDWTNSDKDPNGKPVGVPTGKWLCIEWMHKGDTNETRFWWDGVEHPSLYTKPSTPHGGVPAQPYILPQFKNVWLGWAEYQATAEPFELWLDEIAIDKDRIGCVL